MNDTDEPDEETKETQEDDSDNLDETNDNASDASSTEVNGSDSPEDIDTDAPDDTPENVSDDSNETNESTEDQLDASDMEDNDDVSKVDAEKSDIQDVDEADETSEDDPEKKKDNGTEGGSGDSGDASTHPREEDIHPNKENVEVSDEKDETKNEDSDNLNDKNIDNKSDISNEETNESKADRVNEASEKETNDSDVEKQSEKKQVEQNTEDNSDGDVNNPDSQKNLDNDSNENKKTNNAEKNDVNNKESEANLENKNDNAQVDNPNKSAQDAVDGSAYKVNETSESDEKNNEQESVDKKQAKKKANNSDTGDDSGDDGDIQVTPEYKDIHPEEQKNVEKDEDTQDPKDLGEIQESEAEKKKELEDQKEKEDEEDKDPDKDKKSDAKHEDLDKSPEKSKVNSVEKVAKKQEAENTRQNQIEKNFESKDSQKETQVEKIPNKEASEDSKKPEDNVDQVKEKENVEKKNVSGKSKDINTPESTDKKASSKLEKEKNLGDDKQARDNKFKTPENNVEKNKKSLDKAKETKKSSDVDNVKEAKQGQKDVPSAEQKNKEVNEVDNDAPRLLLPGPKETPNHRNFERINELRAANKRDIKQKIVAAVKAPFEILQNMQNILHSQRRSSNRFQNKRRYRDEREIKASETNVNDLRAKIQRLNDFKNANWDKLSEKEKNEIETIIGNLTSVIGKELDLKEMPKLETYHANDDSVYGAYDSKNNVIYLNTTHLTDGIETIDTLAHEMRHAWQNNSTSDKARKLKSDLGHPKASISYKAYRRQASERDAREYANKFCSRLENKKTSEIKFYTQALFNNLKGTLKKDLEKYIKKIDSKPENICDHLMYLTDLENLKNVKTKEDLKKFLKTDIEDRRNMFGLMRKSSRSSSLLHDENVLADSRAASMIDTNRLYKTVQSGVLVYIYNAMQRGKNIDEIKKDILNNEELKKKFTIKDKNGDDEVLFSNGLNEYIDWGRGSLGLYTRKFCKNINGLPEPEAGNIEKMPIYFWRQGSEWGSNLTSDRNHPNDPDGHIPPLAKLSVGYIENSSAVHEYELNKVKFKQVMDTIDNISSKIKWDPEDKNDRNHKEKLINQISLNQVKELIKVSGNKTLDKYTIANYISKYKKFQKDAQSYNITDCKYGVMGVAAPLHGYEGGAPQYNTPLSVGSLVELGVLNRVNNGSGEKYA